MTGFFVVVVVVGFGVVVVGFGVVVVGFGVVVVGFGVVESNTTKRSYKQSCLSL